MPEIRFKIQWPDGKEEICYSPSLVVREYLESATEYELLDFLARARTALTEGSRRVEAKFGFPCSMALMQLQKIEATSNCYTQQPQAKVKLLQFIE